jgi:hypothetical protein
MGESALVQLHSQVKVWASLGFHHRNSYRCGISRLWNLRPALNLCGKQSSPWLRTYEFIAICLEGIALILIFVWDRLDSRKQHEETLAQLQVSQKQADALVSSERAWVMVGIGGHTSIRVSTGGNGSTEDLLKLSACVEEI